MFRGNTWVYEFLFAKKDRANITPKELAAFRSLAKSYTTLLPAQLIALVIDNQILEICHEEEAGLQK